MKLLLDENLSRRVVPLLDVSFPGTTHVALVGLERADDAQVWRYAREHDFVIVSKDDDFIAMSQLLGHPPRLIKLSLGNCSNDAVVAALQAHGQRLNDAFADPAIGLLELIP